MSTTRKVARFSASLVLAFSACSNHINVESWDQQVLSAVLEKMCTQKTEGYFLLSDSTSVVVPYFSPNALNASAKSSLLRRNKSSVKLPVTPDCENLQSIAQEELERQFAGNREIHEQWSAFYERYDGASGTMALSLPGYADDASIAVVQVAGLCGATCGGGSFWVLHRIDGKWEVDSNGTIQGWTN